MRTLVLVRHGATPWNESGYCLGHRDIALARRGRAQAERLGPVLQAHAPGAVFSSPLARALETARIAGHEPEILADLIEIDRGHWEGHDPAEIRRRWGRLHQAWYEDPAGLGMPGGESFDDLWARAGRVLERMEGLDPASVLLFGHKAINRVILARALGRPTRGVWAISQPQACVSVLRGTGAGWTAASIGDVSHLPPGMRSEA